MEHILSNLTGRLGQNLFIIIVQDKRMNCLHYTCWGTGHIFIILYLHYTYSLVSIYITHIRITHIHGFVITLHIFTVLCLHYTYSLFCSYITHIRCFVFKLRIFIVLYLYYTYFLNYT